MENPRTHIKPDAVAVKSVLTQKVGGRGIRVPERSRASESESKLLEDDFVPSVIRF